jgi:hypothetical protein
MEGWRSVFVKDFGSIFVKLVCLLGILLPGLQAYARDYRAHEGYIESTLVERGSQSTDLQIIDQLPSDGPSFQDYFFNAELTHEFQEKYNDKFGRTDAEHIFRSPNRTSYYNDVWFQGTPEDYNEQRRQFADYMLKRLGEWHVDNYLKTNPSARGIYELKEKVSSVNVQVQSFQFDLRYEIAGNTADLVVKNPYLKTSKIRLQMNPGAFGPSTVDETIVTLGTDISKTVSVETFYSMPLNNVSFVTTKGLAPGLAATASFIDAQRDLGADPAKKLTSQWIRESIYLAGLNYTF